MINEVMSFSKIYFLFFSLFIQTVLAQENRPWSTSWTSLALRSLPVYYEHQNWRDFKLQHQVEATYNLSKFQTGFQQIQARVAYSHPLKPVPDPDFFGFQDLEAVLIYAFNPLIQVFVSGLLPLSKASLKKSLVTSGSLGVSYQLLFAKRSQELLGVGILFRHFISINSHYSVLRSFLESYIYNDIVSLNHEILVKSSVYAGFSLESSVGFQNFYTYSNDIYNAWSAEIRLLYSWQKLQMVASFMRKWSHYDKIVLHTQNIYPYLFVTGVIFKLE